MADLPRERLWYAVGCGPGGASLMKTPKVNNNPRQPMPTPPRADAVITDGMSGEGKKTRRRRRRRRRSESCWGDNDKKKEEEQIAPLLKFHNRTHTNAAAKTTLLIILNRKPLAVDKWTWAAFIKFNRFHVTDLWSTSHRWMDFFFHKSCQNINET